jgi:hypothetical protein
VTSIVVLDRQSSVVHGQRPRNASERSNRRIRTRNP